MAVVPVLSSSVQIQQTARDVGVVIDSRLSLSDHVAAVCRSGCYQLRQLRPVVRCLLEDAAEMMSQALVISRLDYCNALATDSAATHVHAFVTSRVDYCNAILAAAPKTITDRLQRVLNAACTSRQRHQEV